MESNNFLELESLSRRKLDVQHYKKESYKENYLLKYPKRTEAQAKQYALRKVKEEIKKINTRMGELQGHMNISYHNLA